MARALIIQTAFIAALLAFSSVTATRYLYNPAPTSGEYCASLTTQSNCEMLGGCNWEAAVEVVNSMKKSRCSPKRTTRVTESESTMKKLLQQQAGKVGDMPPQMPPSVPLPWTTTQQRTHTYSNVEFLSIAEEQSNRMTTDGFLQQAFYIFPATPFSLRNGPADTIVQGMSGVFTTNPAEPGWVHKVIFLTNLTGHQYCYANVKQNATINGIIPSAPFNRTIRGNGDWGVPVEGYVTYMEKVGTLLTEYVTEARGGPYANGTGVEVQYPLRQTRDYQGSQGPALGYMLDLGQHFPVAIDSWFNLTLASSCPQMEIVNEPLARWGAGVESDIHNLIKPTTRRARRH